MYRLTKLPSGLRILSVPMKNTKVFTLLVLVRTGSKNEIKRINGISHFLEHMFFKGTKHRPEPGQVNRDLDSIGAQHNAFTSKEVTGYWVKAAKEYFDVGLDIVADILTEPLLAEEEINKERGVIIQELRMRIKDDPRGRAATLFESVLWGDQPAGWDVIGTEKTIHGLRRSDFVKYFMSQYTAKNTIVVVAGAFPGNAVQRIRHAFSPLRRTNSQRAKRVVEHQKKPTFVVEKKDTEAANIVFGMRGYSMHHPKRFAFEVLATILGGNSSARLWMEIREKLGLAYYIYSANTMYDDSGYFEIAAGVPNDKVELVLEIIAGELRKIKKRGASNFELKAAKQYILGNQRINLESSDNLAAFIGEQALFKKEIFTPDQVLNKIEKVTAEDVLAAAHDLFTPQKTNFAMVGKNQNPKALEKIFSSL